MGKGNMQFKDLTTFKIGGPIKYFREVKSEAEIKKVSVFARKNRLKIFVLGGGSDILVSDREFDGLVIKYTGKNIERTGNKVIAGAGARWDDLVKFSVEHNLQGLECLSGIPGTVGASPVQNIGAYGQELEDTFWGLKAYDFKEGKFVEFKKKDCDFGYRESIFKKKENWQRYLITSVTFKLASGGKPCVEYESLKNYLAAKNISNPTLKDVWEAVLALRKQKLPDYHLIPNAGSFFKNPVVPATKADELKKEYPSMSYFIQDKNQVKLFAAWLIEKAGWKGKSYKNATVSAENALILTNPESKAAAEEIRELFEKIQKDVLGKFGVLLESEVQFVGFGPKVAILGYGLEGQDAEKYFRARGAQIAILDQKFDKDYLKNLDEYDSVVRSPGVYPYKPELKKAKLTTPIQIFFDNCRGKIIGVTGTKGKGTSATLIFQILKKAGKDVYLAGNIGKPYLELLSVINHQSCVVLELSSFQLIDMTKSPHIAVVLNITSDHLDWHKDQKEYVNAKKNIVKHQSASDYVVINEEYVTPKSFVGQSKAKVVFFSKKSLEKKYQEKLLLRGKHNLENIAAAVTVARILKVKDSVILDTVRNFKGLEHRLELVKEVKGVTFYNDSFATGPQPTIAAIRSFDQPVTLILGGSSKGLSYGGLGKEVAASKQIKKVIIIGQIGPEIIKSLNQAGYKGSIINLKQRSMKRIVDNAFRNTPRGGVVLLSPAAASFDMFANYKDRGNQFKEAVRGLG